MRGLLWLVAWASRGSAVGRLATNCLVVKHGHAHHECCNTAVNYDPKAKAPTWEKFVARIMGHDQEMVEYLQRAVGYSLTGDVSEQVMFVAIGDGSNGKSTFLESIRKSHSGRLVT